MSATSIQAVLNQMEQTVSRAQGAMGPGERGEAVADRAGAGGFADELQASLSRINQLQQAAGAQASAFQSGDPGISLHQVMVDSQKASVAFEMAVQVRNRLVTAYKDIMNMQI